MKSYFYILWVCSLLVFSFHSTYSANVFRPCYLDTPVAAANVLGQTSFNTSVPGNGLNQLNYPYDVHISALGKVFVVDSNNSRILRHQTTHLFMNGYQAEYSFGGSGTDCDGSSFLNPAFITFNDLLDRCWISDANHHRVLQIEGCSTLSTNMALAISRVFGQPDKTTCLEGNTLSDFAFPNGVYYCPLRQALYVSDFQNSRLLGFENVNALLPIPLPNKPTASLLFGQTDVRGCSPTLFNMPHGIIGDLSGNLFLSDSSNHRIAWFRNMHLKASGAPFDRVVGQPDLLTCSLRPTDQTSLNLPAGLALYSDTLFIADSLNHRVFGINDINNMIKDTSLNVLADFQIGQSNFTSADNTSEPTQFNIRNPIGIIIEIISESVLVSSCRGNRVLRYCNYPTKSGTKSVTNTLSLGASISNSDTSTRTMLPSSLAIDDSLSGSKTRSGKTQTRSPSVQSMTPTQTVEASPTPSETVPASDSITQSVEESPSNTVPASHSETSEPSKTSSISVSAPETIPISHSGTSAPSETGTVSVSLSKTSAPSETGTVSISLSETSAPSETGTVSVSLSKTSAPSETGTVSVSFSKTETVPISQSGTSAPSETGTVSKTVVPSETGSETGTDSISFSGTSDPSQTGTVSISFSATSDPSETSAPTGTDSISFSETSDPSESETSEPSDSATSDPSVTSAPSETGTDSVTVDPSQTSQPTGSDSVSVEPSETAQPTGSDSVSVEPSETSAPSQSVAPSETGTGTKTVAPSKSGTGSVSGSGTGTVSISLTKTPSKTLSTSPSGTPPRTANSTVSASPAVATCGNGIVEAGEECDPASFYDNPNRYSYIDNDGDDDHDDDDDVDNDDSVNDQKKFHFWRNVCCSSTCKLINYGASCSPKQACKSNRCRRFGRFFKCIKKDYPVGTPCHISDRKKDQDLPF